MGACQSSTNHVEVGQKRDVGLSGKPTGKGNLSSGKGKPESPADGTEPTGSHNEDFLSPTKTVSTYNSEGAPSPLSPDTVGTTEAVETSCFDLSPRKNRFSKKGGVTEGAATIGTVPGQSGESNAVGSSGVVHKMKGGVTDGAATIGNVPWKSGKEDNTVGSSGVEYQTRGGVTEGDATVGVVPWKSGENNAIRSSSVPYQMQGGPTTANLDPSEYTGPLVPGRDFSARSFVPVMDAATSTPSFAIAHKGKGKIYDEVDHSMCSLCNKASLGIMCNCECGKEDCEYICHTACAIRIQPAPSLSYPGTPAPRLPLILCPTGVSYTLKKKVVKESTDIYAETKVALLKDDPDEEDVPRGHAEKKPVETPTNFTAMTKVAILKDSGEEDEIPRGHAADRNLPTPTDFTSETKVAILRDSDEEDEIPRGHAENRDLPTPTDFTSETKVALLRDSGEEDEIARGERESKMVPPSKDFTSETKVAILRDSDDEEEESVSISMEKSGAISEDASPEEEVESKCEEVNNVSSTSIEQCLLDRPTTEEKENTEMEPESNDPKEADSIKVKVDPEGTVPPQLVETVDDDDEVKDIEPRREIPANPEPDRFL